MNDPKPTRLRALVLTVGTGNKKKLEESLYAPLLKSMDSCQWTHVVLLPSQSTLTYAEEIASRRPDLPVEIRPLTKTDEENDPDSCYSHFESEISRLCRSGLPASDIVADFTRGTKAMSAALMLAAVRHEVSSLRYISGDRDVRGMVVPGSEDIVAISPIIASAQKRLDSAVAFIKRGNFAGAMEMLSAECASTDWPGKRSEAVAGLQRALLFYAAWDRLDYATARVIEVPDASPDWEWKSVWPTQQMRAWVDKLARPDSYENCEYMANRLRSLACDLLANGERRIRDQHFEDALLRAYRVLELVGQFRLFDRRLDSARLPDGHPAIEVVKEKRAKKSSRSFSRNKDGTLKAARDEVAHLLQVLGDEMGQELRKLGSDPDLQISKRNHSVLIHGFEAMTTSDKAPLIVLYKSVENILVKDGGEDAQRRLDVARSLDLANK